MKIKKKLKFKNHMHLFSPALQGTHTHGDRQKARDTLALYYVRGIKVGRMSITLSSIGKFVLQPGATGIYCVHKTQ